MLLKKKACLSTTVDLEISPDYSDKKIPMKKVKYSFF